jgi:hypothetical protein
MRSITVTTGVVLALALGVPAVTVAASAAKAGPTTAALGNVACGKMADCITDGVR